MNDKFHNYKFNIYKTASQSLLSSYHDIEVAFKLVNKEITLDTANSCGSYSLYLQDRYLFLGIDGKSKRVDAFNGELQFSELKLAELSLPNKFQNVIMCIETNDNLIDGSGGYIKFNDKLVVYDQSAKILQIGNINHDEELYKFFKNAFAQISKDGNLEGLMFINL